MTDLLILRDLGFIVMAAAGTVALVRVIKVPSIAAYIIAGLILGPLTGLVSLSDEVHNISDVGIALLLFLVGLELSVDKFRSVGKVAVYAGLGQVVFTAAGGFGLAWLLGFSTIEGLFIATALTFSSTVVVVKLLDQKKEINALYGRMAVGIFLVQDLVVIIVLTSLSGLGRPEAMNAPEILRGLAYAFGGMTLLLVAAALASRYILPRLFGWVSNSQEALFIWSLSWCFLFVLSAEMLELSLEIGAFLAGISLAQLPYNQELRRRVHPLMNFFIAVFFVSLGIQMNLTAAQTHLWPAVILSLFVLIGNPFIFMWIITRLGFGERTSFLTSVTVAQISEFSFIFAALGLTTGLIGEEILSLIAVVGLITIGVSSYMILYNHQLYGISRKWGILRFFGAKQDVEEDDGQGMRGHIIIVGMNSLGHILARQLAERGETILAIDTDPGKLRDLPAETLLGNVDYLSVLEEANLAEAKLLISTLQIEDANRMLAYRCESEGVPSSIHAFDPSVVPELEEAGATHLMISKAEGIERFLDALHDEGIFGR